MEDVPAWQTVVLLLSVVAGGSVQGSIGFGFALVSTAAFGLILPEAIPGTLLLLSFPINLAVLRRDRAWLDRGALRDVVIGLVVGTPCGAAVLLLLDEQLLAVAFGAAIVVASLITAVRPVSEPGPRGRILGGALSGIITTVASTGGPAIALLFQHRPGPQLRAILAAAFFVSGLLSTIAVAIAGRIGWEQARAALIVLPALGLGLVLSRTLSRRIDERWLRPAVLLVAAGSGVAAIVRALL